MKMRGFIITTFVSLYLIVSVISTIHVIDFFKLSNPDWLAISLAIAFEIGAAASLAALIILDKLSKSMVWSVFIILTMMQMMGNTYYAFVHLEDYQHWIELFGLNEEDPIMQKRILSIISGAILPVIALGFIKSLVDYIKPNEIVSDKNDDKQKTNSIIIKAMPIPITEESVTESVPNKETDDDSNNTEKEFEDVELPIDINTEKLQPQLSEEDIKTYQTKSRLTNKPKTKDKNVEDVDDSTHPHTIPGIN